MRLVGQTAVITGAGSGIGRESALRLAAEGSKVVVADIDQAGADETVESIVQAGGSAIAVQADVGDEEQVVRLMESTTRTFGGIHVLINNAAVIMPKRIEDTSADEWDRMMRVNLRGVFLCSKYALPELRGCGGRIVNMASLNGLIGQKGNTAYAASKGAVIAMTKAMAIDYAGEGVRVNCVCPAGVRTPLLDSWLNAFDNADELRLEQERSHLMGRIATTGEIAEAVLFLASDASSFITGQALVVDGGASLGYGAGAKAEWTTRVL